MHPKRGLGRVRVGLGQVSGSGLTRLILTDKIILFTSTVFFFNFSHLIINISFHEDDIFIIFFLVSALFLTDSDIRSDESKIFSLKNSVKNSVNSISKIELISLVISLSSVFSFVSRSSLKSTLSEIITESDFLSYN